MLGLVFHFEDNRDTAAFGREHDMMVWRDTSWAFGVDKMMVIDTTTAGRVRIPLHESHSMKAEKYYSIHQCLEAYPATHLVYFTPAKANAQPEGLTIQKLKDYKHRFDKDVLYIFGKDSSGFALDDIDTTRCDIVSIETVADSELWSLQAATVVLYHRYISGGG